MNKINLEEELLREKVSLVKDTERELVEAEKLLDSVKHILLEDVATDRDVLIRCGFDHAIAEAKKTMNKVMDLKSKLNSTSSRIFSKEEIERVAIKYRLRFLPSALYKAAVPPDLAIKIREARSEFAKLSLSEGGGYGEERYMILAPKESFNLEINPEDPLFFIKLSNEQYYLVHKWGNDLSLSRLITAWRHRCGFNSFLFNIITLTICIFGFIKYFTMGYTPWFGVPAAIITAIIFIAHWSYISEDNVQFYSNDCWNSKFKR